MADYCTFCEIVARREPARVFYEDDDVMVFENILGWSRLMLLAVPKQHRTQSELWADLGPVGHVAVQLGREHAPEGFRILSNFGSYGMQSQPHGHLHILDETDPIYERKAKPPRSIVDAVRDGAEPTIRTDNAVFFDARKRAGHPPLTALALPNADPAADIPAPELWANMGKFGDDIVDVGWSSSQYGFRLLANFPNEERLPGGEKGHIHLLAGSWLGHYV
ncbi:MAG: Diadenosine tetraphosphate (Ap4A) hydrolase [Chloroflexi bacterium]|nr:MAG: Diadenosine tetraphosphate (Ap4A) hydrolase [Chloroflexota bacterium]